LITKQIAIESVVILFPPLVCIIWPTESGNEISKRQVRLPFLGASHFRGEWLIGSEILFLGEKPRVERSRSRQLPQSWLMDYPTEIYGRASGSWPLAQMTVDVSCKAYLRSTFSF
jgi:hypothetical protein